MYVLTHIASVLDIFFLMYIYILLEDDIYHPYVVTYSSYSIYMCLLRSSHFLFCSFTICEHMVTCFLYSFSFHHIFSLFIYISSSFPFAHLHFIIFSLCPSTFHHLFFVEFRRLFSFVYHDIYRSDFFAINHPLNNHLYLLRVTHSHIYVYIG